LKICDYGIVRTPNSRKGFPPLPIWVRMRRAPFKLSLRTTGYRIGAAVLLTVAA